jgi:hypothetical protein
MREREAAKWRQTDRKKMGGGVGRESVNWH